MMVNHGQTYRIRVNDGHPCETLVNHAETWSTMVNQGLPWSSWVDHDQPQTPMVSHMVINHFINVIVVNNNHIKM